MRGRGVCAVESGPGYGHVGSWVAYEAALEDVPGLRFRSRGAEGSAEHGGGALMSVFDPECSGNRFSAEFKLTGDAGSPYEFGIRFSVDGDYFAVDGLSMGDMVRINREFARVIREAKHARAL